VEAAHTFKKEAGSIFKVWFFGKRLSKNINKALKKSKICRVILIDFKKPILKGSRQ